MTPTKWIAPGKESFADLDNKKPHAKYEIEAAVTDTLVEGLWNHASQHFLGAGLETGVPDLKPAQQARRWFERNGHAVAARAVDFVVCGGLWPGGRCSKVVRRCRCGAMETPRHRWWTCAKLDEMHQGELGHFVKDTQNMEQFSKEGGEFAKYECLWGRAIVPASFKQAVPEPPSCVGARHATAGDFKDIATDESDIFTDGSGGPTYAPVAAARTGAGYAACAWEETPMGPRVLKVAVGIAEVPEKQTVPRAELWAAAKAWNEIADSLAKWRLRPDANYVHRPLSGESDREHLRKGANGDLWAELDKAERKSNNAVESKKVKAHQDKMKILSGSEDVKSFVGNHLADCAASAAAATALKISPGFEWIATWGKKPF